MKNLLELPFGKKGKQEGPAAPPPSDEDLKLRLYRLIIERYRDKIEEYETKTVSDLKSLVQPRDAKITEIRDSITEDFHPYLYDSHFLSAAAECLEHLSSFATVSSPVSFWLTFEEMQELLAGDEIDKSILLCSLLRSLGSPQAKVFVTDSKNSYVLFEFSGKFFVADHSQKEFSPFDSPDAALKSLKGKALYSFNDLEYEDFGEG